MRRNIILGLILVVLLIFASVYYFFLGGASKVTLGKPNSSNSTAVSKDAIVLSSKKVVSAVASLDRTMVWYFDDSGQFYSNKIDGTNESNFLLPQNLAVSQVYWPAAGNDFIVRSSGEGGDNFNLYQAGEQKFIGLPKNTEQPAWLPDGKKIIYVWRRGDWQRELKISNSDGSNYSKIGDLPEKGLLVASPDGNHALFLNTTSATTTPVAEIDLVSGKSSVLLDRGVNLGLLYSPDSNKLLFTRVNADTKLPELWLADLKKSSFDNLKISTAVDKIVWASNSEKFYFAQPKKLDEKDPAVKSATQDDIYAYTLSSHSAAKIDTNANGQFDIREPFLGIADQILIFRDGKGGKLYRVNLK